MDKITKEQRSYTMSRIRSQDTKIEVRVRKHLFHLGFRYRKNDKRYPGKPDIVLPKYHTIVFVHGCFWHQHECAAGRRRPQSNVEFWNKKFERNIARDKRNISQLQQDGWKVLVVWECDIKKRFDSTMEKLVRCIRANLPRDQRKWEEPERVRRSSPAGFEPWAYKNQYRVQDKRDPKAGKNRLKSAGCSDLPKLHVTHKRDRRPRPQTGRSKPFV